MKKNKLYGYNLQKVEKDNGKTKNKEKNKLTEEFYDILESDKKKKNHLFTIIIILLVIFGIGSLSFLAYIKVFFTADKFLDNIEKEIETIISEVNKANSNYNYDINNGYELNEEFNFSSNIPLYENLNTLTFKVDTYIDNMENRAYYDLGLIHEDNSLLEGEIYIDKSTYYFNFPTILSKPIKNKTDNSPFKIYDLNELPLDLFNIINYMVTSLKESDTKTINKGLTNIYCYEINEGNKDKVINKFKELMENDDNISAYLPYIFSENWLDNNIEDMYLEIEVNVITQDIIGFKFEGYDSSLKGKWENKNKFRIVDENSDYIDFDIYEDRCNISFVIDGKSDMQISIVYANNDATINVLTKDTNIEIKIKSAENENNLYINASYLDTNIILEVNNILKKDSIITSGSFNIEYSGAKIGIEFNITGTPGIDVPIKIYDNFIEADNLIEEDANEIATNLNKLLNNLPDELTYVILSLFANEETNEEITEQTI